MTLLQTIGTLLAPNGWNVESVLPWIISVGTITHVWLAGNKSIQAWVLALLNQCLWLTWIIVSQTWGMLPLNIVLTILYFRNYLKWQSAAEQGNIRG